MKFCPHCDTPTRSGFVCDDCNPEEAEVTAVKVQAVECVEPDYDARRKQEMVDYGCYGGQARLIRDSKVFN